MNLSRYTAAISLILIFAVLAGCGTSGQTSASSEPKTASESTSVDTPEAVPDASADNPAEAEGAAENELDMTELERLCEEGEQTFVWQIDESAFDVTENVAAWNASETSEDYYEELFDSICKAMFPDVAVTEGESMATRKEYIFSNGISGYIYQGSLGLRVTDEEAFSSYSDESLEDMLVPVLSECVGLECRFSETNEYGHREYNFVLNEIPLTIRGYSYGSGDYDLIGGAMVWFSKTSLGNEADMYISHLPTSQAETISSEDYLSADEIEAICRADMAQYGDEPWSIVFEQATLEYYYSHVSKQFTPCWIITGREIIQYFDWIPFTRIVDAVTGELHWAS